MLGGCDAPSPCGAARSRKGGRRDCAPREEPLVALVVVCSVTWKERRGVSITRSARTERTLSCLLAASVLLQITVGVPGRHPGLAHLQHVAMAMVVVGLGVALILRLKVLHPATPALIWTGQLLLALLAAQVLLGFGALASRHLAGSGDSHPPFDVALETAHQAVGALLLATSVALALWCWRLLETPAREGGTLEAPVRRNAIGRAAGTSAAGYGHADCAGSRPQVPLGALR